MKEDLLRAWLILAVARERETLHRLNRTTQLAAARRGLPNATRWHVLADTLAGVRHRVAERAVAGIRSDLRKLLGIDDD